MKSCDWQRQQQSGQIARTNLKAISWVEPNGGRKCQIGKIYVSITADRG